MKPILDWLAKRGGAMLSARRPPRPRRKHAHYDPPRPVYTGPAWIGKPITKAPEPVGPDWIGKRIPDHPAAR